MNHRNSRASTQPKQGQEWLQTFDLPADVDTSYGQSLVTRPPSSARRYQGTPPVQRSMNVHVHNGSPMPRRASNSSPNTKQPAVWQGDDSYPPPSPTFRWWLPRSKTGLLVRLILVLLCLWIGGIIFTVVGAWVQDTSNTMTYGYPRTAQVDKDVGHGGISHFTVENLGGHIFVYEITNNDASKAQIYVGQVLAGSDMDKMPATLDFRKGSDGNLDMVIIVDNLELIYVNGTDGKFHAQGGN